ncbi:MAG: cysteine desulfurase family protein [Massiliimalia sp.]
MSEDRENQREIYLDNSATTRVCPESAQAVMEIMTQNYGNAASLHRKGYEAEQVLIHAKKTFASVLGCQESEIYFTSGATESNNMCLIGAAKARRRQGNKIVITGLEHPSVLEPAAYLEREGWEVVRVMPNEQGSFTPEQFAEVVDENTVLVSTMFVNNETGLILPVQEIAKAVKRKNPKVLFHTDAVQGFMKLPLKLRNSQIDLLSASGHKVYAPKGIGLLYIKKGVRLTPLFYGGGQQNGVRVGTDSVPLIGGFAAAVEANAVKIQEHLKHYQSLKEHLLKLAESAEEITVNSTDACAPFVVNLSVDRIRSEVMLHFLEQRGIYVSSGSACSKGEKSHVLRALGLPSERIDTALRLSFSPQTTKEDLDEFMAACHAGYSQLAKLKR